jgi:hypothetical protein
MKVGDVISWNGTIDDWEVTRVSPCAITVRNTETRRMIQISPASETVRTLYYIPPKKKKKASCAGA